MKEVNKYNPFTHLLERHFNDQQLGSKWICRYIKFIKAIQQKRIDSGYPTEKWNVHRHHIVPKSWGGPDVEDNMITMTLKEHIVAHHLLCKTMDPSMGFAMVKLMGFTNKKYVDPNKVFNYAIGLRIAEDANRARHQKLACPVINLNTGKKYESVYDASMAECGNDWSVATALLNHSEANNCYWMRESDITNDYAWHIQQFEKEHQESRRAAIASAVRKVVNLTTGQCYESASIAARDVGVKPDSLSDAIRNRTSLVGCLWEYQSNIAGSIEDELKKRQEISDLIHKYSKCRQIVDLKDDKVFNSQNDVAIRFHVSTAVIGRHMRSFRPYRNDHYFVKKQLVDDVGKQQLLTMLNDWNKSSIEQNNVYKKTKSVVNLTTGQEYVSASLAQKEYLDNISYCVLSKNPGASSGCYWMYKDEIIKPIEEHLKENQERYEKCGAHKRRKNNSHTNVPVIDLMANIKYSSILDFANNTNNNHSLAIMLLNQKMYCMFGTVLVPQDVYEKINDTEQFIHDEKEKYRLHSKNNNVVNLTTKKVYSSCMIASKYCGVSSSQISGHIRKNTLLKGNMWTRERSIPYDQYQALDLEFVE